MEISTVEDFFFLAIDKKEPRDIYPSEQSIIQREKLDH